MFAGCGLMSRRRVAVMLLFAVVFLQPNAISSTDSTVNHSSSAQSSSQVEQNHASNNQSRNHSDSEEEEGVAAEEEESGKEKADDSGFIEVIESQVNLEILARSLLVSDNETLANASLYAAAATCYVCNDIYCELPLGAVIKELKVLAHQSGLITLGIFRESETTGDFELLETFHHKYHQQQTRPGIAVVPLEYEVQERHLYVGFICGESQQNCVFALTPLTTDISFISMPYSQQSTTFPSSEHSELKTMVAYEMSMMMQLNGMFN